MVARAAPPRLSNDALRARLVEVGLSQAGFARAVGMGKVTVNGWCVGRNPVPPWVISWLRLYEDTEFEGHDNMVMRGQSEV